MCGLYSFRRGPEEARRLFACEEPVRFAPRPYIGPGQPIGIVRLEKGRRTFSLVHWGFIPSWTKEVRPGRPLATRAKSHLHSRRVLANHAKGLVQELEVRVLRLLQISPTS